MRTLIFFRKYFICELNTESELMQYKIGLDITRSSEHLQYAIFFIKKSKLFGKKKKQQKKDPLLSTKDLNENNISLTSKYLMAMPYLDLHMHLCTFGKDKSKD